MTTNHLSSLPRILWQNGYRPVPIDAGLKYPYQKNWPDLARTDPPWLVQHGVTPQRPGIGLLCDGLQAADIDIDDPQRSATMLAFMRQFGAAPTRFRASSPRRLLLYRADEGEPPKSYVANKATKERVELLGRGQQAFAYGTHPESGETLQWIDGPDIVKRANLPTLTRANVEAILLFAGDLIDADRQTLRPIGPLLPRDPSGDAWCIGDIVSALAAIPNTGLDYDWWFSIGCAVYDASGGSHDGYQAWLAWSLQCGGASQRECDKVWSALHSSPLYYSAGTLAHYARDNDPFWDKPSFSGFIELRAFNKDQK